VDDVLVDDVTQAAAPVQGPQASRSRTADVALALDRVSLAFGAMPALEDVSLEVRSGEIVFVLGPSGSGKSTLLRLVSGIERPQRGEVRLAGATVAGPGVFVEPEDRRVGMVFQDFALFPHLTVEENVAFGVRAMRQNRDRLVANLLERLDIGRYARRYPHMLSGGERQRVALARALAPRPSVLLMDEPFSSLDEQLRDRIGRETLALLREMSTTTVVVTHDPREALRAADRVALLRGGRLLQYGAPDEVYLRPASVFAARFLGDVNVIATTCRQGTATTAVGTFPAASALAGADVGVCIRPQYLRIAQSPTGVRARVEAVEFLGETERVLAAVDGVPRPLALHTLGRASVNVGDVVWLDVDADRAIVVIDDER
jgi:iron(III) transport system ATP-binding protein